jgi:type VI secretion system protein
MTLTLRIISGQQAAMGPDSVKTFNGQGGSIGRVASNDWVLPDAERYLSSRHCAIHFRDGAYYLEDTSTNGVYVNAANDPLGKGQSLLLHDGDRLSLGDYEIAVEITQAANYNSFAPAAPVEDPFTAGPITDRNAVITSPTHPTNSNFQSRVGLPVTDPLELLGKSDAPASAGWAAGSGAKSGAASPFLPDDDDFLGGFANTTSPQHGSGSQVDNLPAVEQFFQPPASHNEMIPDDWDLTTGFGAPATPPPAVRANAPFSSAPPATPNPYPPSVAPTVPPAPPMERPPAPASYPPPSPPQNMPPVAAPAPAPAPAPVAVHAGDAALMHAFLEGAGIADLQFAPEQSAVLMRTLGQMTREMVQGMMEMLMARASLKSEFRMPMTVIRPVENNPLKFCVTADDALRTMLVKQGGGYLPPLAAVQDGFGDIKGHQMALMAGMQAAFEALLQRFNPQEVEGQADKGSKLGGLLPAGKKARAWELYTEVYKELAREAEDNFQALLGEEFARAYEEQIQKIDKLRPR